MIKTRIQVPEEQYEAIREFARRREWSLAETFRRGAELLLQVYPPEPQAEERWVPPSAPVELQPGLDPDSLKKALRDDEEAALLSKL